MSPTTEPLVVVDAATRAYAAGANLTVALQATTCNIWPKDRVALVGPSGSGKSTLMHLMAGLDGPSSGTVTWPALGAIDQLRPERIGMVFQSQSLVPWLDAVENVALPLQLAGRREVPMESALGALRRFDLDHLATKLPDELSGGQAQRICLARAIVTAPSLILADEPTGQLDRATASHLIDMLLGWADETGAAVVIATHDLAVANRFATRWQMEHGVLNLDYKRLAS